MTTACRIDQINYKKYEKTENSLHIVYMGAIMYMKVEFAPHLALGFKGFFFRLFCFR